MKKSKITAKTITRLAMLLALVFLLSYLESVLPALPGAVPGVRLGLSNIVTMYCLFFINRRTAFVLAVLKSGFVFLTRGAVAGLLSLCGGILSILVIILLMALFKDKLSYLILSVCGAVFHNIGQILAASVILKSGFVLYYIPALIISGIVMGTVTAALLRATLPAFSRVQSAAGDNKNKL